MRKFIHALAEKDKVGACKDLGIQAGDAQAVSQVEAGISALGGKAIDDITCTVDDHSWTNGVETLDKNFHVRSGKEGFYVELFFESTGQKSPSIKIEIEEADANPWEVRTLNFFVKYWVWLLGGTLLSIALGIYWLVQFARSRSAKTPKPPKIPAV